VPYSRCPLQSDWGKTPSPSSPPPSPLPYHLRRLPPGKPARRLWSVWQGSSVSWSWHSCLEGQHIVAQDPPPAVYFPCVIAWRHHEDGGLCRTSDQPAPFQRERKCVFLQVTHTVTHWIHDWSYLLLKAPWAHAHDF
jgi:hypothetical protein